MMRFTRGPLAPMRDAAVITPRAAWLRLRPAALTAALALVPTPAAAWDLSDEFGGMVLLYLAGLLAVIALGAIAWYFWVRAEIRSLQAPAFLVLRRDRADRLAIAGAEPDATPFGPLGDRPGLGDAAVRAAVATSAPRTRRPELAPVAAPSDVMVFPAGGTGVTPQPEDATLQFLPGRLECICEPRRPDIRFLRQPGPATIVTIGRAKGSPDRHIHLAGPTVSRMHARLRYASGGWTVSNLSGTNPLRVNGQALEANGEPCPLADGDRLELGELAFIFRERSA